MMAYTYKAYAYAADLRAGAETDLLTAIHEHPQAAVDVARATVREYSGPDLPRAVVTRSNGIRGTVIFRAWRSPDGVYHEERVR